MSASKQMGKPFNDRNGRTVAITGIESTVGNIVWVLKDGPSVHSLLPVRSRNMQQTGGVRLHVGHMRPCKAFRKADIGSTTSLSWGR